MGAGASKSNTSSSSKSNTSESALSREQLGILRQRESQYQQMFFPELVSGIQENSVGSETFNAGMQQRAGEVNAAFNASDRKTTQNLAQQGLLGQSSGVQAAVKASGNRARSSALAQSYYDQLTSANQNKYNFLTLGTAMSPTPTTSAEYHSQSKSSGDSSSWSLQSSWMGK